MVETVIRIGVEHYSALKRNKIQTHAKTKQVYITIGKKLMQKEGLFMIPIMRHSEKAKLWRQW